MDDEVDEEEERARIRIYCEERDAMLRKLSAPEFLKFARRWRIPLPTHFANADVPLIMIHKCRLVLEGFTGEEKALSRGWLTSRGYTLEFTGYMTFFGGPPR